MKSKEPPNIFILPQLDKKNIHLWWIQLNKTHQSLPWELLSPQEKLKAQKFKRSEDGCRYCLVRGTLRQLLAQYLNQPPQEIFIRYGNKGKPWVLTSTHQPVLHFNLSHSGNMALFGFRRDYALGVDIEKIQSTVKALSIAHRFFTANEYEFLKRHKVSSHPEIFFQLWTRKESCIKAIGGSLFEQISSLEVPLMLDCSGKWVTLENKSLHVQDIFLKDGYKAAIATFTPPKHLVCREWCPQKNESKASPS